MRTSSPLAMYIFELLLGVPSADKLSSRGTKKGNRCLVGKRFFCTFHQAITPLCPCHIRCVLGSVPNFVRPEFCPLTVTMLAFALEFLLVPEVLCGEAVLADGERREPASVPEREPLLAGDVRHLCLPVQSDFDLSVADFGGLRALD